MYWLRAVSVFIFHFMLGFFVPRRHHAYKGFWSEYSACRLFAQLMLLASLQSCFSWPHSFDALPPWVRVAALGATGLHVAGCLVFCVRNALLCLRNVEYSEGELAAIFQKWRSREVAFQTLLDAQLAFIGHVQAHLHSHEDSSPSRRSSSQSRWLLMRQVAILTGGSTSTPKPLPGSMAAEPDR